MSYQFKNSKISNFQEMIGQALLDGSFQQLEGEKQMELFLKGYEGQPQKLVNLAQNLGPGFQKGLIKFNPQELVDKATELIPQKKIQRNNQQQRKPVPVAQAVVQQPTYQPQTIAANNVGIGFNPMKFVEQAQQPSNDGTVPISQVNPANRVMNNNGNAPLTTEHPQHLQQKRVNWPKGYDSMEQGAKCDVLRSMINTGIIAPIEVPVFGNINDLMGMKDILSRYYTFIPNAHQDFDEIQMRGLGLMITHPKLAYDMKKLGCTDPVSEPKFLEVNIEDYHSNLADRYDFAFLLKTNDRNKAAIVMLDSVPHYDEKSRKWFIANSIQDVTFGKNRRNPFFPKKKLTQQQNDDNRLQAPIGEVVDVQATEVTTA